MSSRLGVGYSRLNNLANIKPWSNIERAGYWEFHLQTVEYTAMYQYPAMNLEEKRKHHHLCLHFSESLLLTCYNAVLISVWRLNCLGSIQLSLPHYDVTLLNQSAHRVPILWNRMRTNHQQGNRERMWVIGCLYTTDNLVGDYWHIVNRLCVYMHVP